jgi:hypothetical protein
MQLEDVHKKNIGKALPEYNAFIQMQMKRPDLVGTHATK